MPDRDKQPRPPSQKVSFAGRLAVLCATELSAAQRDPDRIAAMIERLASSLAFTISIAGRGKPDGVNELLEGTVSYLYESATRHQRAGEFLNAVGPRKGDSNA